MKDTILLTGATGFLGTELAARLSRDPAIRLYALVRASDPAQAAHRLRIAWQNDDEMCRQIGDRIIPVPGDFSRPGLGLNDSFRRILAGSVTLLIHAGAQISFQKSREELELVNTAGTDNVLSFAGTIQTLRRFIYISTAYVAGQKTGLIMEDDLAGDTFSSFYEQSKAKAEELVRSSSVPFSICRPGMIVGDSRNGQVKNFNTIYYVLKQMLLGKMRVFPIKYETALNLVPVDYVADSVIKICFCEKAEGRTFHLTCPKDAAPAAGELAEYVRSWAQKNLALSLPRPLFLPIPALKKAGLLHNKQEAEKKKDYLNNLLTLLPYFFAELRQSLKYHEFCKDC